MKTMNSRTVPTKAAIQRRIHRQGIKWFGCPCDAVVKSVNVITGYTNRQVILTLTSSGQTSHIFGSHKLKENLNEYWRATKIPQQQETGIYKKRLRCKQGYFMETNFEHFDMGNKVLTKSLALTFVQVSKMTSEFFKSWNIWRYPGIHSHPVTALYRKLAEV